MINKLNCQISRSRFLKNRRSVGWRAKADVMSHVIRKNGQQEGQQSIYTIFPM